MTSQAEVDGKRYCDLMEEVKLRMNVVNHFLSGQGHVLYKPATLETVCLQIRKILELIAFGSLVANKEAYTATYAKVSKAWNAGEILTELAKVNPNFYPVPVVEARRRLRECKANTKRGSAIIWTRRSLRKSMEDAAFWRTPQIRMVRGLITNTMQGTFQSGEVES